MSEKLGFNTAKLKRIDDWVHEYVDSGKLSGMAVQITRHGKTAYRKFYGKRSIETGQSVTTDTIYRFYSMTKPVTSVALMQLYEKGLFQLDQPIADFIPEFADVRVYVSGGADNIKTEPLKRPVTLHDLLTHTAGLTYGWAGDGAVEQVYQTHGIDFHVAGSTLAEMVQKLCKAPLCNQPGERWTYSVAFDVLGHLIELISGQELDVYFQQNIFEPLGMVDTGFFVPAENVHRLAACYVPHNGGLMLQDAPETSDYAKPTTIFSGGGGLVSTMADYQKFIDMLRCRGKAISGSIIGRKAFDMIVSNHMGGDIASRGQAHFSETTLEGIGFGLGMSVMLDPARAKIMGTAGEFAWGGMASTAFWVDPVEDMTVILLTQLIPSNTYTLRRELRVLSYSALI